MKTKTSFAAIATALVVPLVFTAIIGAGPISHGSFAIAFAGETGWSVAAHGLGASRADGHDSRASMADSSAAALDSGVPQENGGSGFVITLKNGSSVKGRTLSRDQASGMLRLTMSQDANGQPKSYAMIAMDDADSIRVSSSDTDSIQVKVRGGTVINCKEFSLSPDTITLKIGTRSTISVPWDQIESISFAQ